MDMSMSVYRVGKIHIGCNIKNTDLLDFYVKNVVYLLFKLTFNKTIRNW